MLYIAAIDTDLSFSYSNTALFASDATTNAAELHDAVRQTQAEDFDGVVSRTAHTNKPAPRFGLSLPSWLPLEPGGDALANKVLMEARAALAELQPIAEGVHTQALTARDTNLDLLATITGVQYSSCLFVAAIGLCFAFNIWLRGGFSALSIRLKASRAGLWLWFCQTISALGIDIGYRKPSPELLAQVTIEIERTKLAILSDQAAIAEALQRSTELSTLIGWWALLLLGLITIAALLVKRAVNLGCAPEWVGAVFAAKSWRRLNPDNKYDVKAAIVYFMAGTFLLIVCVA